MDFSRFTPEQIQAARETVANWFIENARAIRREDEYADHVTESKKDEDLNQRIEWAERLRAGLCDGNFTARQRIYYELTGECVALLPKSK